VGSATGHRTDLVLAQQLLLLLLADGRSLGGLLRTQVAQALQLLVVALRQRAHIKG
jgi:hypothetical protein